MSNEEILGGKFEPIYAAHAIEQVAFMLRFEPAIEKTTFEEVQKLADAFKAELPIKSHFEGVTITPGAIPTQSKGCVLSRTGPDGEIESELRLDHNSITFRTTRYSRWLDVWQHACKYLDVLIPVFVKGAKIEGIGLNYVDKFKWSGDVANCQPNKLLLKQSKYICPNVFEEPDFWHSHTGAFRKIDGNTKRLMNINIDYLDEIRPLSLEQNESRRVVAITTVLTDLFNQPGYSNLEVAAENAVGFINEAMQKLHLENKKLLGEVINEDMKKRIALTTN